MKPRAFILLMAALCMNASAFGTIRWVGPATYSGDVLRPQSYLDTVAPLLMVKNDFESLMPGAAVSMQNFGIFTLTNSPYSQTSIIAKSGTVAGALPTSGTMALHLTAAPSQPTTFIVETTDPVMSVAFSLMGLESAAWLYEYGGPDGNQLLGQYSIAGTVAGVRRWVGLAESSRVISKIKLTPTQPEDYAIDDLEIAVHAPEPSMLIAWVAVLCMRPRRGSHAL